MTMPNPWRTGAALAITMAISYTVCAALYALWPEQGVEFLNALFHGLDFHKLAAPATFRAITFIYPLAVLVVWGFGVGALFGFVQRMLADAGGRS
jgi:hypothetical protein